MHYVYATRIPDSAMERFIVRQDIEAWMFLAR